MVNQNDTLIDSLARVAAAHPDRPLYRFLADSRAPLLELSAATLEQRASALAGHLLAHTRPGERALLLFPQGLELIVAFFACLRAGVVAVPVPPPRSLEEQRLGARLLGVVKDSAPALVLTTHELGRRFHDRGENLGVATWLSTDDLETTPATALGGFRPKADDLAFLQYTSGSTGSPRGVRVRHRNLIHNAELYRRSCGHSERSVLVGWLPFYHDMGLIGVILQAAHVGASCVLTSPLAFLKRPLWWLELIARFGGTTSGGPNFAYELCVQRSRPEERAQLDLSSWEVAFNGAEPIRAETLERFAQAFAPAGFRRTAFYTCYGLAEATLLVSGGPPGRLAPERRLDPSRLETGQAVVVDEGAPHPARRVVGCGQVSDEQRLLIVDPTTHRPCPDGVVGEIWLQGPSVADGYWQRPTDSQEVFAARLSHPTEPTGDPFLRTGDLGFLDGAELFVTGRLKDLVIVRGRNHYPQDLEWTVEHCHPSLRAGGCAAFALESEHDERLVVVQELDRRRARDTDLELVFGAIRAALTEEHEVEASEIVLIEAGTLPKTSSGKVQRRRCREELLAGELRVVARRIARQASQETAPASSGSEPAAWLRESSPEARRAILEWTLRRALAAAGVALSDLHPWLRLGSLGLDSLAVVELRAAIERETGIELPISIFFDGSTFGELVEVAAAAGSAATAEQAAPRPAPPVLEDPTELPLSAGQLGLWLAQHLAPGSGAHQIAFAGKVVSTFDDAAFERALRALLARHEVLRAHFVETDGQLHQRLAPTPELEVVRLDGRGWAPLEVHAELSRQAARPLDVGTGPLVRCVVLQAGSAAAWLLLVFHHLIVDLTSLVVIGEELGTLYGAARVGRAAALEPPQHRFRDFVDWQNQLLASRRGEGSRAFWHAQLAERDRLLELPTDRPRPALPTLRGVAQARSLTPAHTDGLKSLARDTGATLFSVLLGQLAATLGRLSGQEEVVIGFPAANRNRPEMARVVGYLVNPLALPLAVPSRLPFRHLLAAARTGVAAALEHQAYPFPVLVDQLGLVREPSRTPLFQVLFAYQGVPRGADARLLRFALGLDGGSAVPWGGLELEPVALEERHAQFDLELHVAELESGLRLLLKVSTDLFDAATGERLLGYLTQVLESSLAHLDCPLGQLELLSPAERAQLLARRPAPPAAPSLHASFEAQARRTPERIAAVAADEHWSYDALDRRAQALAQRLQAQGLGPEQRVALLLRRTPRLLEAALGTLKAGAAFVGLDPAYPRARTAYLLRDSGAALLLRSHEDALEMELPASLPTLWLEPGEPASELAPSSPLSPGHLAYLIYTSGSTGEPKAVAIEHASAAAFVAWSAEAFSADEVAGVLAATSICFDLSVFEWFAAWNQGGTLVLADNALALTDLPSAPRLTLLNTVPSAMAELLQHRSVPAGVRTVNLAGEPLPETLVQQLFEHPGIERVWNLYGPSEDTTYSTGALLLRGSHGKPPIGTALPGRQALVLAADLELVPTGVVGEIWLAGSGLARGYLDRPRATAERFRPHPYPAVPGERAYRTGDLARRRPDGALEFLGRSDQQVKVRGFRIELGEIESCLRARPELESAAAFVISSPSGSRLAAAVLRRPGVPTASGDRPFDTLVEALSAQLPAHHVPTLWIAVESLPLLPNGKLDRQRLPSLAAAAAHPTGRPLGTPTEERLAELWSGVLGSREPAADDDFFAVGGDSLSAVRLVARIRSTLGLTIAPAEVFQARTLSALAARLDRLSEERLPSREPLARRADDTAPALTFAQERLWVLSELEPDRAAYNIPAVLRLQGPLERRALARALRQLVDRHGALRARFPRSAGRPQLRFLEAEAFPLRFCDLSSLAPGAPAVDAVIEAECRRGFDLARGPLLRATLLALGPEHHILLLLQHHIVTDGWSLSILLREISTAYEAARSGRPPSWPPLPFELADYADWQRRQLAGPQQELLLRYWRDQLAGAPRELELPTDRPRAASLAYRGATVEWRTLADRRQELEALARREGVSLFMVLLTAWGLVLSRLSGQTDLVVGTFSAHRVLPEIEGLIGFFINNLALRLRVQRARDLRSLLAEARSSALGAFEHQELPFEHLLADLKVERPTNRTPLFQNLLVVQNLPPVALELAGVEVEPIATARDRAEFDLSLWVEELGARRPTLEYDADLFDAVTVERWLGLLDRALDALLEDTGQALAALTLLTPEERSEIVRAAHGAPAPPREVGLFEQVRRRCAEQPDAIAVVDGETAWSYAALHRATERVAERVLERVDGREPVVAFCLERSALAVAVELGILAAGAAFLPLDPKLPRERLERMVEQARTQLVLTTSTLATRCASLKAPLLLLEAPDCTPRAGSTAAPSVSPDPQSLAYVLFTSGSTGEPKGVLVERRSLLSYSLTAALGYELTARDRVLQFAALHFDASLEEIYPTLLAGATLVLRSDRMLATPSSFFAACRELAISVLDLPTSYWHGLVGEIDRVELPKTLRCVILGGEKALPERVRRWQANVPPRLRLVNSYGPTEATIVATVAELDAGTPQPLEAPVPIGRAVAGLAAYVVDDATGDLALPGVAGHLYLGGVGIARGYLGRPALTAESFVPDPFSGEMGGRLYRTGDRARIGPSGQLAFLDRRDHQVKVRGYRIELAEIETQLVRHPQVREALAAAPESAPGQRILLACAVPRSGAEPTEAELRRFLGERLPDYMMPAEIHVAPDLPRTSSGKVDRNALQPRSPSALRVRHLGTPPRTLTEMQLAALWCEILGLEAVNREDDFFALGGFSLLATQVLARIHETFGVELSLGVIFESPRLDLLAQRIDSAHASTVVGIPRVGRGGDFPMSFAQERVWFLTRLDPSLTAYHVPRAIRCRGPLSLSAMADAYRGLIARHEILRTTFHEVAGEPVQRVHATMPFQLGVVDLTALSQPDRERWIDPAILELGRQLFDLGKGPMIRAVALRVSPTDQVLMQVEHHLVHDGWAEGILIRDLLAGYHASLTGEAVNLPELPIQFADFAVWQRRWLESPAFPVQLRYWKEKLEGAPTLLPLPTDRPRQAVQSQRGHEHVLRLPPPKVAAAEALGARWGTTLFMVSLAAFTLVMARASQQTDLVLGTGVANRRRRETEGLLGMIINTLPLRLAIDPSAGPTALLHAVRETCLGAYSHQDVPFDKLVEELRPARSLSHAPLFQVMYAFHDVPHEPLAIAGVDIVGLPAHNRSAKFDMLVIVLPQGAPAAEAGTQAGDLLALFEYNADLYDASTVARWAAQYALVLETLAAGYEGPLSQLPLLSPAQRHQLVVEWNDTTAPRIGADLGSLFTDQARRRPEAIALRLDEEAWSYGQLEAASRAIAIRLGELGIGSEQRVAICLERSAALVVALLGVLRAGAAYVPLDPSYPQERLAWSFDDAHARLLITRPGLAEAIGEATRRWELPLEIRALLADPSQGFALPHPDPSQLAYLIYTSGSTGRPKGVAIEHRSALARIAWAQERYSAHSLDGVLASTSICFDLSVFELFVPLGCGGCVILAEDALALPELPGRDRVRLLNTVPSAMAELARPGLGPERLETINLAGEALTGQLAQQVFARYGEIELFNLYGPSEDTTYSTAARISPSETTPAIGRPLPGTTAYVLDAERNAVGLGVVGELYLSGVGLARGYLGQPARTAERFLPNPFATRPGERMFRTGDRVRQRPTGDLDFLGRDDGQVKVRGFRIELSEIDARLAEHPAVRECVTTVDHSLGEPRLQAHVAFDETATSSEQLRAHLASRLPSFMVPSVFVTVPVLPRLPNGKIDRRRLPAAAASTLDAAAEPPRTSLERTIAEVWCELLGLQAVGREADFFGLGGHSLLATRVVARIAERLGVSLPLRAFFEATTPAAQASRVASLLRPGSAQEDPPRAQERPERLPLSFAQQRLWFLHQLEPSAAYNVPAALLLEGPLAVAPLLLALAEVVARHEALRTSFHRDSEGAFQRIHPQVPRPGTVLDLSSLEPELRELEARRWATLEVQRPFDLEVAPPLRLLLVRLSSARHLLLLNTHHIASDGWSIGILIREVLALCAAPAGSTTRALAPLPLQYADFALWQRRRLSGEHLESLLTSWRQRLVGAPPALALPFDRPRPAVSDPAGAQLRFELSRALAGSVESLARSTGTTPFMVLLAAFAALLHRLSREGDLVIGTPVANREHADLEPLIGFFANTLPLRLAVRGQASFATLLEGVREVTLASFATQELPFERLVEELAPERNLALSPLFQVLFVLHNAHRESFELRGLEIEPLEIGTGTAKFDLSLALQPHADGLHGWLEYRRELFDTTTVQRFGRVLEALLTGLVEHPGRPLDQAPLCCGAERQQLLHEWNASAAAPGPAPRLLERIAAQVAAAGDGIAVVAGDEHLSFAALDERATRLARALEARLTETGVGPTREAAIAVLLERSLDMVTAVLAVLRAGAAYVPLDPSYPSLRLAYMLEDCGAPLLLTTAQTLAALADTPLPAGLETLDLETEMAAQPPFAPQAQLESPAPEALAYVIYTSGSTGRPKGTALPHRAVDNLIEWYLATLGTGGRSLQLAALSFDVSFLEIFASLAGGGRLDLVVDDLRADVPALARRIRSHRLDRIILPVVVLHRLAEILVDLPPGELALTDIAATGEALTVTPACTALAALHPTLTWHNYYGPSEAHVVTAHRLLPDPEAWAHRPPIGRAIERTHILLLGPGLEPVPIGVPAELYIGGDCLGRGYLRRPALTAEKFVPDPFATSSPGARLYRTGDLARWLANGEIEFLGRIGRQLKLRGYRIEPSEIEAVLLEQPGISDALVCALGEGSERRLVAYWVGSPLGQPSEAELRRRLREKLPEPMVPSRCVEIPAFPLGPTGKIDLAALPAPGIEGAGSVDRRAPRTPREELMATLWSSVLGVETLGIDDSFFDLGGHSLLATQLQARIRETFAVDLPLRKIFEQPTLGALTAEVEARSRDGSARRDGPIEARDPDQPAPLSFAQERFWFLERLEATRGAYNLPALLELPSATEVRRLVRALGALLVRHEALRSGVVTVDGKPRLSLLTRASWPLRVIDLGAAPGEADRLAAREAAQAFDLARPPLVRALLLRAAGQPDRLVLNLHHAIADGWSIAILLEELTAVYRGCADPEQPALPAVSLQYPDFAAWQRKHLSPERIEVEVGYWRRRLEALPPSPPLPADRPQADGGLEGLRLERRLPASLARELQALSRRQGVTPFMVLLATLAVQLSRFVDETDLAVGTPVAGRLRRELEPVVGCLINTLVLRVQVPGHHSLRETLLRLRPQLLEDLEHQELPFEKLVEHLRPTRLEARTPLFQALFALQNTPSGKLELEGEPLQLLPTPHAVAAVDLSLTAVSRGDELDLALTLPSDRFDAPTGARLLGHFEVLLASALAAPEAPLESLSLLTQAQRTELIQAWNPAPPTGRPTLAVHELVAARARELPEHTALVEDDACWSYAEIERRAERLAARLRLQGLNPEQPVAVFLDRSSALVVALLATLKAGGVYLPLDPTLPPSRVSHFLADSRATVLLSERRFGGLLPNDRPNVVWVDEDPALAEASAPSGLAVAAEQLAYLLYTSGSTGTPKAVMVRHGALAAYITALGARLAVTTSDHCLLMSSINFDGSLEEIFVALTRGATLYLRDDSLIASTPSFFAGCRTRGLTVIALPTAYFHRLAARLDADRPPPTTGLRVCYIGGEKVSPELAERWLRHGPRDCRLINSYGPTETTIVALDHEIGIGHAEAELDGEIPIGRPVAGVRAYVLDRRLEPVPIGCRGELHLAGSGVARGYLRRPGLTAAAFLPDPFQKDGARLYRTGDLARRRSDGSIEFLGRRDRQHKVRGFRVELGEVEAALLACPEIAEVVVVPRELGAPGSGASLVAYVVARAGVELVPAEILAALRPRLPEPMLPAALVQLPALPLTTVGKLDLTALPAVEVRTSRLSAAAPLEAPRSQLERQIAEVWQRLLGVSSIGLEDNLFELGAHSLLLVEAHAELVQRFGERLELVDLFRFPTLRRLAEHLDPSAARAPARVPDHRKSRSSETGGPGGDIAIIGLAGRFPEASSVEQLWQNLRAGREAVTFFSDEELLARGLSPEHVADPSYVKAGAVLDGADLFDAALFGYTPREAEVMDPQQRLLHECTWEALDDAGYDPERFGGRIGLFAGTGLNRYWFNLLSNPEWRAAGDDYRVAFGNDKDFLTTRISYKLNLRGPSINVQTACSTSLVAVHLACRSLLAGECELAVAGAAGVDARQGMGHLFTRDGISSPDGHCRPFDARGQGIVKGSGLGLVVLRPLAAALAAGDRIRAVIKGSAINNDGSVKVGYMAPSLEGQTQVIRAALEAASVEPATISYVECHGTATELGDYVEVSALGRVFADAVPERGVCALGSIKSNIGHLDTAAGIASLIKTVLALEHRELPPTLHFETPNPRIDFAASPFFVNAQLRPWTPRGALRRAGVSSFGVGGTNAHVVLEEAPTPALPAARNHRAWQLLRLSAHSPSGLEKAREELAAHLEAQPTQELADVAHSLAHGRRRLGHRLTLVCRDRAQAQAALSGSLADRVLVDQGTAQDRAVAFLFPGLGDQYPEMARGLYEREPRFRQELDPILAAASAKLGAPLRPILFPAESPATTVEPKAGGQLDLRRLLGREAATSAESAREIDRTLFAHPAVFALEVALAKLWMAWGVRPEAALGYSLGEYTAAWLAGVLSLDDALTLVVERARLIEDLPAGAMLAIGCPEAELEGLLSLHPEVELAATNTAGAYVVAGSSQTIAGLAQELATRGTACRRLRTRHAFHSGHMRPITDRFLELVRGLDLRPPRMPFVSNVTGRWITAEQATDPGYWVAHLCGPVRFSEGLGELLTSDRVLLEVGPGQTLTTFAAQHPAAPPGLRTAVSLRDERQARDDQELLLTSFGRLWLAGVQVDDVAFEEGRTMRRVAVPKTVFERQRYWIEPQRPEAGLRPAQPSSGAKQEQIDNWFYLPSWRLASPLRNHGLAGNRTLLIFADSHGVAEEIAAAYRAEGHRAVLVRPGERAFDAEAQRAAVAPGTRGDYAFLLGQLRRNQLLPDTVLHLWGLEAEAAEAGTTLDLDHDLKHGFTCLSLLAQAFARELLTDPVQLDVVASGLWEVDAGDPVVPMRAAMLALLKVIPQEYRHFSCRALDCRAPREAEGRRLLSARLRQELAEPASGQEVALRGRRRLLRGFEPIALPPLPGTAMAPFSHHCAVLITGGLGRIGSVLALGLAERFGARLALVSRTEIPPTEDWPGLLAAPETPPELRRRLEVLRAIEAAGGVALPLCADVTDAAALGRAVAAARAHFGRLDGAVHMAGRLDSLLLDDASPERCQDYFAAKARGAWVLSQVLAEAAPPTFGVLFSSVSSVLGGLGFAPYASANAYLDALAHTLSQTSSTSWVALNWDGLRDDQPATGPEPVVGASLFELAMTPEETVEAFVRAVCLDGARQIVVSTGSLTARLERWIALRHEDAAASETSSRHPRPRLQTPYAAPTTELEHAVAGVWQDLLGIDSIGRHDDFFELGGDSLLATRLLAGLRRLAQAEVSFRVLFEASTIAGQAEVVERLRQQSPAERRAPDWATIGSRGQDMLAQLAELESSAPPRLRPTGNERERSS